MDRLHARNNQDQEDYSFLNAVGAVWPAEIDKSAAGYLASTGFLIDRCHVLTNLHTVNMDDLVVQPSVGKSVSFAVGQTEGLVARMRATLPGAAVIATGGLAEIVARETRVIERVEPYRVLDGLRLHYAALMQRPVDGARLAR